jgi:hypothetical protein
MCELSGQQAGEVTQNLQFAYGGKCKKVGLPIAYQS